MPDFPIHLKLLAEAELRDWMYETGRSLQKGEKPSSLFTAEELHMRMALKYPVDMKPYSVSDMAKAVYDDQTPAARPRPAPETIVDDSYVENWFDDYPDYRDLDVEDEDMED